MSRLTVTSTGRELLDDPATDPATVTQSLHHIARANWWFGGLAAVRYGLARLLRGGPSRVTLLDVGTGNGDVPLMARGWGRSRGIDLTPIGLDPHPVAARITAAQGVTTVRACGGYLPVRTRGVDVVVVSQVAHHLEAESCVTLFRECTRVARLGVIVADLRRSSAARAGFWLGSRLLGFDAVTRADGLTSLRRGYTAPELRQLIARAGIEATVVRRPAARLVALWQSA